MSQRTGAHQPPDPLAYGGEKNLVGLLLYSMEIKASDMHLSPGYPPMFRVHSVMTPTALPPLSPDELHEMLYEILNDDQRKRLERDKELDFALQIGEKGRFRVNCFYNMRGEGAVFRSIPSIIKSFEELNLPPVLREICDRPRGLVLVTGPTGSGKSTTLAAMIDYLNSCKDLHILTIEDPIEFVHPQTRGVVNQRELGPNTLSFAAALRSALREDPDVILVGEMRDLETISLALTAAETGHLVFGTLHTQSAPKTVDRIVDVFPPEQQKLVRIMFAESFQAIICQTLLRKKSGDGRVAAMEIMIGTPATRSLIREAKTHQLAGIIQTSQRIGMQSLDQCLKDLVMRGVVHERDAVEKANNPDYIRRGAGESLEPSAAQPGEPHPAGRPEAPAAPARRGLGASLMPTMDTPPFAPPPAASAPSAPPASAPGGGWFSPPSAPGAPAAPGGPQRPQSLWPSQPPQGGEAPKKS